MEFSIKISRHGITLKRYKRNFIEQGNNVLNYSYKEEKCMIRQKLDKLLSKYFTVKRESKRCFTNHGKRRHGFKTTRKKYNSWFSKKREENL